MEPQRQIINQQDIFSNTNPIGVAMNLLEKVLQLHTALL
jgi:hypothetical protein